MAETIEDLLRAQREMWLGDIEMRERAKTDPEYAKLMADADAEYERRYGKPWLNPLTVLTLAEVEECHANGADPFEVAATVRATKEG